MMRLRPFAIGLVWLVRVALGLILISLVSTLFIQSGDERSNGPGLTGLPAALALLDPSNRAWIAHSLALAVGVAVLATALGQLAALLGQTAFASRAWLGLITHLGLVSAPLFSALGLLGWLRLARPQGQPLDPWLLTVLVGVAHLPWSVALVAQATRRRLDRLDPAWWDQARLAGGRAGVWRASRHLVRPWLRTEGTRLAALVFLTVLCEPAAPLVLGQLDNLAARLVVVGLQTGEPIEIATLATLAYGLALAGYLAIRAWSPEPAADRLPTRTDTTTARPSTQESSVWLRTVAAVSLLIVACLVALPAVGLLVPVVRAGGHAILAPEARAAMTASLRDGLRVAGAAAPLVFLLAAIWRLGASGGARLWSSRGIPLVPCLILAVAIGAAARQYPRLLGGGPARVEPFWTLVLALSAVLFPPVLGLFRKLGPIEWEGLSDAARLMGAGRLARLWLLGGRAGVLTLASTGLAVVWCVLFESQASLFLASAGLRMPAVVSVELASDQATQRAASLFALAAIGSGCLLRLARCRVMWLGIRDRG